MKILVISESINVEDSSGSKVNVALIHNLKRAGFTLKVLHFSHQEINLEDIECVLINENKFSVLYLLSRLVKYFQAYTKILISSDIEKIFGFSFTHTNDTRAIKKGIKKHLSFKPDLVLTLSKGGSFRPHRAVLKLPDLHSKWIANMHDPYPFHVYPRPYDWVEKSYQKKEEFVRSITEKAKYMAFPSLLLKNWMESYFPAIINKSIIIPHQIKIEKSSKMDIVPQFFKADQFNLLHAGNLLPQRNPKFLVEAFIRFLKENPAAEKNSNLYLIGDYHSHTETLKDYQNHPNIFIRSKIAYKSVQILEQNATANIILEAVSEISPFLPGKFPNCVIANKPIIILGPYYSEVRRLLGRDYQYWAEANNVDSIQTIINRVYLLWNNAASDLTLNRKDLVEYSTEIYLKKTIDNLMKHE